MNLSEPLSFEPIAMERVWGGRRLETILGKKLPPGSPFGESWELVDREEAQSVVHSGPLQGSTLHDLWTSNRADVFGTAYLDHPAQRFPILIKLLDARERLSLQVHPPAQTAHLLGGEPKTEAWYFLDCLPGASIFAGLHRGVTRDAFEEGVRHGMVEDLVPRLPVSAGESIFIPSGRLHAIGEGCLIAEIQQNSDTTYRVFDWNRMGLDGQPRELHIDQSLASIDFTDFEPHLTPRDGEVVAACEHFLVEHWSLDSPRPAIEPGKFAIIGVVSGQISICNATFDPGSFFLVPANLKTAELHPLAKSTSILRTTLPV